MSVSLFSFVEMYGMGLGTLGHILKKARAHVADHGLDEGDMLGWRLADDMFPLWRQAQIVANFGARWPARAAGLAEPDEADQQMSFDQLFELIDRSRSFVDGLKPSHFAGKDAEPLTIDLGVIKPTMPIEQWITGFATTNFYFHLSMVYAILRHKGVPLGKPDLFAGGL